MAQFILPGLLLDRVAASRDTELSTLAQAAPFAYISGDERRVRATAEQAARLRAAAEALLRTSFNGSAEEHAARTALRTLSG
ncbi:hypothetical protein ABZS76_32870 [Streptomyces sp. NPDC005562]|uniref:hypothetical protein n=1 Tax=Streptomyces sp. NPDC005562 TaxID=3154890 RepID=UPI0033AF2DC9